MNQSCQESCEISSLCAIQFILIPDKNHRSFFIGIYLNWRQIRQICWHLKVTIIIITRRHNCEVIRYI